MNGQSLCREPTEDDRRCGRLHGHPGEHECCHLHARRRAHFEAMRDRRYGS